MKKIASLMVVGLTVLCFGFVMTGCNTQDFIAVSQTSISGAETVKVGEKVTYMLVFDPVVAKPFHGERFVQWTVEAGTGSANVENWGMKYPTAAQWAQDSYEGCILTGMLPGTVTLKAGRASLQITIVA